MTANVAPGNTSNSPFNISPYPVDIDSAIDVDPLVNTGTSWSIRIGPIVSISILVAVAYQLRTLNLQGILVLLPSNALFWACLAGYYLAGPISEWIIFRRLWRLPIEGFAALLRKLVSNEILLGYLGEVYFYAWARRNARITTAPFGAIKDVAILSALTGNAVTLVMVVIAAPLFGSLHLGVSSTAFVTSTIFLLLSSLVMFLIRKRLFTLPRRDLAFVAAAHVVRITATMLLAAMMWHLLLPTVAIATWLLLVTMRQLLSRLPFLPNKDIVFAGLASFLVGSNLQIVSAMALTASLILSAHLLVGTCLGGFDLLRARRR